MSYIVNIETVKIKDFLFSTNKLKCIQGASYLLDFINNIGIRRILNKYNIKNNTISFEELDYIFKNSNNIENDIYEKIKGDQIFYIAAGNAKFIVDNEEDYYKVKKEIELLYEFLAPGAKIVIEKEKINNDKTYSEIISSLAAKTNIIKSTGIRIENIDLPMMIKCQLSNSESAEISVKNFLESIKDISYKSKENLKIKLSQIIYPNFIEKNREFVFEEIIEEIMKELDVELLGKQCKNLVGKDGYLSRETLLKIMFSNFSKYSKDGISFYSQVIKKYKNIDIDCKIEEYPELDDKSNIGFLYSDGDGLGEHIKNKTLNKTNEEYLRFIKPFSIILDYITKSSLIDALEEVFSLNDKKIGAFFIVGGDDVCALFKSTDSIKITEKYLEKFSEKMKKVGLGYENITTSCGLLIAKDKVPIHLMMKQSLILQKNAKKKRYEEKLKKGYIDFQNIASEGNTNIKKYRESIIVSKDDKEIQLLRRPYCNDEFIKLVEDIIRLKEMKFPTSKLRYFYEILSKKDIVKSEKNMRILNALFNTTNIKNNKDEFLKIFGINITEFDSIIFKEKDLFTNILDVIELYEFIKLKEDDNNE